MARGLAKVMGFDLRLNFKWPYFAANPSAFWRGWHINLSTWLRDYLYISLGGNRDGKVKTYRNLMTTMVLGGMWHGAAWNFVLWGAYHGAILIIHRLVAPLLDRVRPRPWITARLRFSARLMVMFHLTCLGWLLFRGRSVDQILGFLEKILFRFSIDRDVCSYFLIIFIFNLPLLVIQLLQLPPQFQRGEKLFRRSGAKNGGGSGRW